jgi:hypothetical protein
LKGADEEIGGLFKAAFLFASWNEMKEAKAKGLDVPSIYCFYDLKLRVIGNNRNSVWNYRVLIIDALLTILYNNQWCCCLFLKLAQCGI